MDNKVRPPRKKEGRKRQEPESTDGKRPGDREHPAAPERTGSEPTAQTESRPVEESVTPASLPVTNQDEQERITNAEGSDRPANL